jgi:CheY-like chemotaxis protein
MLSRVLYVDDDEALTELAELVLDMADIETLSCHSGRDAIVCVVAPYLVLLDREMPEMNGLSTLRALRQVPGLELIPAFF